MNEQRLFLLQRLSALILAPLVLVHLLLILYAVRGGLTAAEILDRTRGSLGWALFYGGFVLAAALHGSIGLRNIVSEWTGWRGYSLDATTLTCGLALALLGLFAVYAVVAP